MSKLEKTVIIISTLLLLGIGITAFYVQDRRKDKTVSNDLQTQSVATHASSADAMRQLESLRIADEDLYQKLKEHRAINILVVGDDIGSGSNVPDQNKWITLLTNQLNQKYQSSFSIKNLPQSSSNIVEGWVHYTDYIKESPSTQYDLIFLCFGQYDQKQVELKEFHMFYEKLLRQIISSQPKSEIIPIIENSMATNNGYAIDIKDLTNYYGLPLADTAGPFQQNKNQQLLSKDNVHPNNAGYQEYANIIFSNIVKGVDIPKTVAYAQKDYFFSDTKNIENYKFINTSKDNSGFAFQGNIYTSNTKNSSISFAGSGNIIYVYYKASPAGGAFQIYIDGK